MKESLHRHEVGDYVVVKSTGPCRNVFGVVVDDYGHKFVVMLAGGTKGVWWDDQIERATKEEFEHADMMSNSENRFV